MNDSAIEPMAEILIYRLSLIERPLTDREKRLGKALSRFITTRNEVLYIPLAKPKRGRWTGLRL